MEVFFAVVTLIQLCVTLIMGAYFFKQLKTTQEAQAPQKGSYSRSEQERLIKLRSIRLSEPLAEKARPENLSDIIGQAEGIRALRAILCGAHPQHVIIYGPPGVGKTCAARLMLEEAKRSEGTPFCEKAPFIEVDATCVRFDERSIADPLIGSVHDPIYQGAGPLGMNGIPQPREGAVTRAHGGVLFLDEIGEMQPIQMNKLLKVLEDRKVRFESAYYDPDDRKTPAYIHDIFKNGLPADFRLVAATTRSPEDIPPALRSRCMEVYFRALEPEELADIAEGAAQRLGCSMERECAVLIGSAASCGRDAVNIVQMAASSIEAEGRSVIGRKDIEWVMECCGFAPRSKQGLPDKTRCGRVNGLAVYGTQQGAVLRIDASVAPGSGRIHLTGAVDQEEIGSGRGRTIRRSGMAKDAAEKAAFILRSRGILNDRIDVHIDFPGGIPVDGPSAGLAMCIAAYSAIYGVPVRNEIAMTGEISMQGDVLPVGGVSRKIDAAERIGCSEVLIPHENWQEAYAQRKVKVTAVRSIEEAMRAAFSTEDHAAAHSATPEISAERLAAQGSAEGLTSAEARKQG
ncbi:MAG: ATP-dependent protease LonB [Clostridia bacterium]|nr:ATP-dependent protease LonB [Clostridia bacterium]